MAQMRDSRPYGFAAALMLAMKLDKARKTERRVATKPQREMTEREKWNAEVEARKAEKKAKRAASKGGAA